MGMGLFKEKFHIKDYHSQNLFYSHYHISEHKLTTTVNILIQVLIQVFCLKMKHQLLKTVLQGLTENAVQNQSLAA